MLISTQQLLLFFLALSATSCVSKKVFQAEKLARTQAESRELILERELHDRKQETTCLIEDVGELNRIIGKQEGDIAELKDELLNRAQQAGDFSNRWSSEKKALESTIAEKNDLIARQNSKLFSLQKILDQRQYTLGAIFSACEAELKTHNLSPVLVGETIEITLPDAQMFETNGVTVAAPGRQILESIARLLTARPALGVEIVAYTDNQLPKNAKGMSDTWDWSLIRAANITRLMIADLGVNANQLTPVGKGEFYPVASNQTPEGRRENRRTVLIFRPALPIITGTSQP